MTLIPACAVTIPTESTLITSSYVNVPPIDTLPLKVASPVTPKVEPSNVRFALSSNSPPVPAITIRLSVKSSTLNVFA